MFREVVVEEVLESDNFNVWEEDSIREFFSWEEVRQRMLGYVLYHFLNFEICTEVYVNNKQKCFL